MVNNIVYFGRIITTILLISLIRPIRLISLIRPIHLVRLISHSRATLAPLSRHSCPSASSSPYASSVFRPVWTPDSGNRTPSPLVFLLSLSGEVGVGFLSLQSLKSLRTLESLSLSGPDEFCMSITLDYIQLVPQSSVFRPLDSRLQT